MRFMAAGEGFSLVEHPIAPRTLAAPMHVHEHEDEKRPGVTNVNCAG